MCFYSVIKAGGCSFFDTSMKNFTYLNTDDNNMLIYYNKKT